MHFSLFVKAKIQLKRIKKSEIVIFYPYNVFAVFLVILCPLKMMRRKLLTILLLMLLAPAAFAGRIERGFEALRIYNYFKAKQLFEKSLKKAPAGASYGLSIIYYRTDNPFSNIDSAYAFILRSEKSFATVKRREFKMLAGLGITGPAVHSMKDSVHQKAFDIYSRKNSIES